MVAMGHRPSPDLENGTFRNPILPGDRPDPSVLKVGDTFYLTYSSFDASPGLSIWKSSDLVNWHFVTNALPTPLSTVFAPDFIEHEGRFYIYIPFVPAAWSTQIRRPEIWVICADHPEGPWSEPVFTGIANAIDPGHIAANDGSRYLFVNGIRRAELDSAGLHAVTELEPAYAGWDYPEEWVTEAYALEGPKFFRRGEWFYLVSAVGGTGGPATGHMVIVARSKALTGIWENSPHNPVARTASPAEPWWSRGHATILEVASGKWWMVSHGYERRFRTLGRQTLLEPITWTDDGWPLAAAADLGTPLPKPETVLDGQPEAVSAPNDDFFGAAWGSRWVFDHPEINERERASFDADGLTLQGHGEVLATSSPMTTWAMDRSYEIEVELEIAGEATGGLLLYFNQRLFCGMGWDGHEMSSYAGGLQTHWREPAEPNSIIQLRLRNDHHIVTGWHRKPQEDWVRHGVRYDTEGYQSATMNDLKSLRPALFATGSGSVKYRRFRYRTLPGASHE